MKRSFSESEILFIKNNYLALSHAQMGLVLGRTTNSVQLKCSKLQLLKEKENFIGRKFNKLTILSEVPKEDRKIKWIKEYICLCDCGKKVNTRATAVIHNHSKSCGCLQKEIAAKMTRNNRLPKGESSVRHLENGYKQSAKRRKLKYSLTHDQFVKLVSFPCHYCGSPPKKFNMFCSSDGTLHKWVTKNNYDEKWALEQWIFKNGIDRKDNSIGYILENCVSCCDLCNRAKNDIKYVDFVNWINIIRGKND